MLKHVKNLYSSLNFNDKGMSIVEVLVAAGLAAIVSLGIATMMQNSMNEQKKQLLLSSLKEQKIRIESLLRDQNAFARTIADATNNPSGTGDDATSTGCLLATSACNVVASTAPRKLIVRDSSNAIIYDLLTWSPVAGTNGFTEGGAACSGFVEPPGVGVDSCPVSYKLAYRYICTAGTSCRNPQIAIVARLVFNPAPNGVLSRFTTLLATGDQAEFSPTATGIAAGYNGKYDAVVIRTATQTNRQFQLAYSITTGGVSGVDIQQCSTALAGAGTCSVGSLATYPTTGGNGRGAFRSIINDNLVTIAGGSFSLTEASGNDDGPYSCTVQAQPFATGGFTIELYNSTDAISIKTASTTAGLWSQSTALLEARFIMQAGKSYTVRQMCQAIPPVTDGYDPQNCSLGMRQENYTSTNYDYVTVNCYKLDKDL
ncbi:MAG: hypothetical protein ABL930_06675 [Pseudobdellovibrio sp.]